MKYRNSAAWIIFNHSVGLRGGPFQLPGFRMIFYHPVKPKWEAWLPKISSMLGMFSILLFSAPMETSLVPRIRLGRDYHEGGSYPPSLRLRLRKMRACSTDFTGMKANNFSPSGNDQGD